MYDLLVDLLSEDINTKKAVAEQDELIDEIEKLRSIISLKEESIKKEKTTGAIKKTQKSIVKNALRRYDKRTDMINALLNKDILTGN